MLLKLSDKCTVSHTQTRTHVRTLIGIQVCVHSLTLYMSTTLDKLKLVIKYINKYFEKNTNTETR